MAQRGLHESMVGQVLAIVITFPALALVTVILRLYTRLFLIKNASREDVCICIAMVGFKLIKGNLSLTLLIGLLNWFHNCNYLSYVGKTKVKDVLLISFIEVKHGLGRPIATVDPALLEGYFKVR